MKLLTKPTGALRDTVQNLKQGLRAINRQRLYRRRMKKGVDYGTWIANHDTPSSQANADWHKWVQDTPDAPFINLLLPVNAQTDAALAKRTIASIQGQIYANWRLFIVLDPAASLNLPTSDDRIQTVPSKDFSLASTAGAWAAILEAGDQLRPQSLLLITQKALSQPDAKLVYTDEDLIDRHGQRSQHHFKPDWNYDFQLSTGYLGNAWVIATDHLLASGGHDLFGNNVSSIFDTTLRCIETLDTNQIAHVAHVLWHKATSHRDLGASHTPTLQAHLNRISHGAVAHGTDRGHLKVAYPIPTPAPLVSIVICTRNQYKLLRTCIESIVNKTSYPAFEIILVDNGSDEERTLNYLKELPIRDKRIRVIRDNSPFNYSALNNMAVEHAHGELVALLNNDIEVIKGDWLTEMVGHALRPEIGCVGAKLLYPNDTVQHAGVLVGSGPDAPDAIAAHYQRAIPKEAPGYAKRAIATHQLTAVTAACLVIRTSTFKSVGGLDSKNLAVTYNDVDFCLRVRELGLHNLLTPHAVLYHHESVSRGRDASSKNIERFLPELAYMQRRWGTRLQGDPCYNPNLSHQKPDFLLAIE